MRILVIEDDEDVASYIIKALEEAGHNATLAVTGKQGLFLATTEDFDVLVVDRMLPAPDGLSIIRTLRASDDFTPALLLSALGEVSDRVKGLKAGGDDYLTKPFAASELIARLEALTRRVANTSHGTDPRLALGDLEMDLLARSVKRDGKEITLQPREFRLLEYLMRNSGNVVTRTMLLEHVWDYYFDPQTNVIDVHISRLRQKIDKEFETQLIHTVRGAGYTLRTSQP
ncbi:MAG: Transcriptional regulatory protein CusR [Alphaproteobacteria bacterium MarineAlpha11_Bin1]|nr:MAG: Transcriptional regulatory protein CusR [Alphaproteobacteria bacterium MarineAlpha11_Bin1]|tara:strand:- start:9475 stop:10161 length:687 start_codon:yes stop_codon:yes gene_type:complete